MLLSSIKCQLSKNKAVKEDAWYLLWKVKTKVKPTNSCKVSRKNQHHSFLQFPLNPPKVIQKLRIPQRYFTMAMMSGPLSRLNSLFSWMWKVEKLESAWPNEWMWAAALTLSFAFPTCVTNLLLFTSSRSSNVPLNVQHPDKRISSVPLALFSCKVK